MILVTGATGRMGGETVKALVSRGAEVRAMVRNPDDGARIQGGGVEIVVADLEKPESVDASLQDIEKVFLLSPEGPRMAEQHGNFAKAAKRAGVVHLVRMSMLPATPDSPLAIGQWHGEADRLVMESGILYTILKPAYFMQNTIRFAPTIASDGAIYGALGDGKVGMVDLGDLAAVAAETLTSDGHEGKIYFPTGPEALSMNEVAEKLSAALGQPVKYVNIPPDEDKAGMTDAGMPDWMADAWEKLSQMISQGGANKVTNDVIEVTGKEPRSFDQFARDHTQAFQGG